MIVYRAEGAALDSSFVGWGETHQSLLSSLSAGSPPKQPEGQNTKLRNYSFNYFVQAWRMIHYWKNLSLRKKNKCKKYTAGNLGSKRWHNTAKSF